MLVKVDGRSLRGEGEVHRREGSDPTPTLSKIRRYLGLS